MIRHEEKTYNILGACFRVYKNIGCGFLEAVYQECMEIEFDTRKIPFTSQPSLNIIYRGKKLRQFYQPDFIVYDTVILEIKAISNLADEHQAQLLNYLHASQLEVGLLVNFGHHPKVEYKRMVL